jgi:hypothetical protein
MHEQREKEKIIKRPKGFERDGSISMIKHKLGVYGQLKITCSRITIPKELEGETTFTTP